MGEKTEKILDDKKIIYSLIALLSFLFIIASVDIYNSLTYEDETNNFQIDLGEPNRYIGLVQLGLAPDTKTRQPRESDIDTGVKLKYNNNIYSLIESRTWATGDYGKTFVIKNN